MVEEIDVENGRNSNFEGLVTLILTFDPAIPHTVVHHSSTCTYIPNFMEMGRKKISNVNTDVPYIFPLYIIRSTLGSRPKNTKIPNRLTITFGCML